MGAWRGSFGYFHPMRDKVRSLIDDPKKVAKVAAA
jgi:hypothetical protein